MDVKYCPPGQDETECHYLRRNFLNCLREKTIKDNVPVMTCNPENLIWWNLECPDEALKFKDPAHMRKTFLEEKELASNPNIKFVRL